MILLYFFIFSVTMSGVLGFCFNRINLISSIRLEAMLRGYLVVKALPSYNVMVLQIWKRKLSDWEGGK